MIRELCTHNTTQLHRKRGQTTKENIEPLLSHQTPKTSPPRKNSMCKYTASIHHYRDQIQSMKTYLADLDARRFTPQRQASPKSALKSSNADFASLSMQSSPVKRHIKFADCIDSTTKLHDNQLNQKLRQHFESKPLDLLD